MIVLLPVEKLTSAVWDIIIVVVPTPVIVIELVPVLLATLVSITWYEKVPVLLEIAETLKSGSP